MQYKVVGSNDISNIIKTVLNNRGIDNWSEYIDLDSVDEDEHSKLDNIDMAVQCFASHIERGSDIGILFDTDT